MIRRICIECGIAQPKEEFWSKGPRRSQWTCRTCLSPAPIYGPPLPSKALMHRLRMAQKRAEWAIRDVTIQDAYQAGDSMSKIAGALGLSKATVHVVLQRSDLLLRGRGRPRKLDDSGGRVTPSPSFLRSQSPEADG